MSDPFVPSTTSCVFGAGLLTVTSVDGGGVIANALIGYTESIDIAAMIVEAVSMRMPLYLLFLLIVSSILSAEVGR